MANRLSMANINAIQTLHQSGHSNRKISKLLGVDRGSVNNYVRKLQNPPNAPTGSQSDSPPSSPGPESACQPYLDVIRDMLDTGLSAQSIFQDLRTAYGCTASYYRVRRFVARLQEKTPLPVRRIETATGQEAQIDFGTAAHVVDADGKLRRPWLFRVVLSHSRKAYSEAVWRQTTDEFIAALENAFHYFGGVPKTLVIDNLKAAVARADWYDPEVHPKLQSFATHYGTAFLPTKPYTPQHKGKIENGVKYAKNNALKGRRFNSLAEQNEHLLQWEQNVADTRIHGTTKQQVGKRFEKSERNALLPLPRDRFPSFHEGRRTVSRDGHVEVDKAYYSAPPEFVGRRLWVRWDAHIVRLFDHHWQQLAENAKAEPGRFRTAGQHIPKEKMSSVERGTKALLRQVSTIGPHTQRWADATVQTRGVEAVRVLLGLRALAGKYDAADLEKACQAALAHGAYRLRTIRELIRRGVGQQQQQFDFLEHHLRSV